MNTYENEKRLVYLFRQTADKVGFWIADAAWAEAGLNDDYDVDYEDRYERAARIAREFGVRDE